MGNYIEIQDQLIRLRKKESLEVTTPAKAINEAIEFCKTNNLTECELDYEGFLFDIEPTSDLKEKLSDFNSARAERSNDDSGLHLQNVSGSATRKKRQPCYFCGIESTGYSMIKRNGIEENLPTCSDHAV